LISHGGTGRELRSLTTDRQGSYPSFNGTSDLKAGQPSKAQMRTTIAAVTYAALYLLYRRGQNQRHPTYVKVCINPYKEFAPRKRGLGRIFENRISRKLQTVPVIFSIYVMRAPVSIEFQGFG